MTTIDYLSLSETDFLVLHRGQQTRTGSCGFPHKIIIGIIGRAVRAAVRLKSKEDRHLLDLGAAIISNCRGQPFRKTTTSSRCHVEEQKRGQRGESKRQAGVTRDEPATSGRTRRINQAYHGNEVGAAPHPPSNSAVCCQILPETF